MDIAIFKKLGLNDKEIKIYLKLLEYGAISVRGLAELTNLNRGTVYDVLKKLQDLGIVSYYHQQTKQRFVAEEPEKMIKLVNDKEEELNNTKKKLESIIPELKSLQGKGENKPTTKFYEGKPGIKLIMEDVLLSMFKKKEGRKEYYVYSATHGSDDINKAYPNYTQNRIKKEIHVKAISLAQGGKTHGLDERRWLGVNDKSATYILIYANKCAFISRDAKGAPVGVIIENRMIYGTQKVIFLRLWGLIR